MFRVTPMSQVSQAQVPIAQAPFVPFNPIFAIISIIMMILGLIPLAILILFLYYTRRTAFATSKLAGMPPPRI